MKKITLALLLFILSITLGFSQAIFSNPITGRRPNRDNPYTNGQIVSPYITVSGIGRGPGVAQSNADDRYNARGWNNTTLNLNDYFQFVITPNAGFSIDFISFEYTGQRSAQGPTSIEIRSSVDGFTAPIGTPLITGATIDLTGAAFQNIATGITFRVYAWNAPQPNATFSIDDFVFNANINSQPCLLTTTWDGANWDNGDPDINSEAIIDAAYFTGTSGSFTCCSLTINPTGELTVNNGNFVEVKSDVVVEDGGDILVETQGSFIQNIAGVNAGTFTLNGTGSSQVNKLTSPLANWYNYTFWSSPVENADVDVALSFSDPNLRFYFDANNFISTIEPDIDDDGNDWTLATGTGIMVPGRGYAATHTEIGFVSGLQYQYNFIGPFNTGDISYPIVNDPINTNHWNLVGNPYPSAIRVRGANGLFNENTGVIDQVAYLWSHSSPPLDTNPGNQTFNFNRADYAVINAVTEVPGASGITPENYIPSGQSFFVRSIANGNITFNNSMRLVGENNNDLFFRMSPESQTNNDALLRVNLTTEEGIFSQLAVAYVDMATASYDGMGYDTTRNMTSGYPAFIYSRMANEDYNLVIQSKHTSNLDVTEIIPLGMKISISEPLIYSLSLGDIEGDFLATNNIYIKDNLLNTVHNLKDSAYSFTSEAGEFNDRFEIVFQESVLGTDEIVLTPNHLSVVELKDGRVAFEIQGNQTIEEVVLLDLVGREVYRFIGHNFREVYDISQLSSSAFIAQVKLSNGQILTKKALKRK